MLVELTPDRRMDDYLLTTDYPQNTSSIPFFETLLLKNESLKIIIQLNSVITNSQGLIVFVFCF